jgi:hypothetical protein
MAQVPKEGMWMFRTGRLQRLFFFLVALIFVKVIGSPFLGAYGNYIVLIGGVLALAIILWRFFRRDPSEGVGIKLN